MKLWKEIAAVVSLLAQAGASNLAFADPHSSAWKQEELNEQFMRSLTKQQCMVKTVADLKAGCTTEQCMKTLGGITGDCVTWATGSIATFCADDSLGRFFQHEMSAGSDYFGAQIFGDGFDPRCPIALNQQAA